MQIKTSTLLKMFITTLPFSFFFDQTNAQCVAAWISKGNCYVKFGDASTGSPTQWLWDFGDGKTDTLQDVIHTYSASGTYTVCLTISNKSCSDSVCHTLKIDCSTVGISSSSPFELSLSSHNPVRSSADIYYSLPSAGNINLTLFDVVGNKIKVLENAGKSAGIHSFPLVADGLSKGIYFIRLNFEGAILMKKIIIAR